MVTKYLPQLRDAEKNCRIGVRGCLNFFQDAATMQLCTFEKGNNIIPAKYNICWMYTKYRLVLEEEADFEKPLDIEIWIEKIKTTAVLHQALSITCEGRQIAKGRLESCLVDINKKHLTKLSSIEFPEDAFEDRLIDLGPFRKLGRKICGMDHVYSYTVRYSDLDSNNHMTNLRYIPVLMDAFDADFYEKNLLKEMEINYISQCFFGEEIDVFKRESEEGWLVNLMHKDGTVATTAFMRFEKR